MLNYPLALLCLMQNSQDCQRSYIFTANFCPEQEPTKTNKFTFPKTVLGQIASSRELCAVDTPNGIYSRKMLFHKNDFFRNASSFQDDIFQLGFRKRQLSVT